MTKQEYFNLLVETSRNGGFPAIVNGICKYRCEDGRKCAVGLLIDDNVYRYHMEGKPVEALCEYFHISNNFIPEGISIELLSKIQNIHDSLARQNTAWDHEYFVKRLKEVLADCQEELTFNVTLGEP